jgi:hypothetical protein
MTGRMLAYVQSEMFWLTKAGRARGPGSARFRKNYARLLRLEAYLIGRARR